MEEWRTIPGYEPYEASNMGNIRNGRGRVLKSAKTGSKDKQYLALWAGKIDVRKQEKVHRLVLMAFCGLPKEGQLGLHKDDNSMNNKLENLYWGTQKQNVADSVKSGTHYKFPKNNPTAFKAVIPNEVIHKIKTEYMQGGTTQKAVAEKYGVNQVYVSYLIHDKRRVA